MGVGGGWHCNYSYKLQGPGWDFESWSWVELDNWPIEGWTWTQACQLYMSKIPTYFVVWQISKIENLEKISVWMQINNTGVYGDLTDDE